MKKHNKTVKSKKKILSLVICIMMVIPKFVSNAAVSSGNVDENIQITTDFGTLGTLSEQLNDVYFCTPDAFEPGARGMYIGGEFKAIPLLQLKFSYLANKTQVPNPELVYAVMPSSSFKITTYRCSDANKIEQALGEFRLSFKTSADGNNWSNAVSYNYQITQTGETRWVSEDTYTITSLPGNAKFIKVIFPQNRSYSNELGTNANVGQIAIGIREMQWTPRMVYKDIIDYSDYSDVAGQLSQVYGATLSAFDRGARGMTVNGVFKAFGLLQLNFAYLSNQTKVSKPFVVYPVDGGTALRMTTYVHSSAAILETTVNDFEMKLFYSDDGGNYKPLDFYKTRTLITGENDWIYEDTYSCVHIPESARFIKILFPQDRSYYSELSGKTIGQLAYGIRQIGLSLRKTDDKLCVLSDKFDIRKDGLIVFDNAENKDSFSQNVKLFSQSTANITYGEQNNILSTGDSICVRNDTQKEDYTVSVIGDIDGNGVIDVCDTVLLSRYLKGAATLFSAAQICAGDANKNSSVDYSDIKAIKELIIGIKRNNGFYPLQNDFMPSDNVYFSWPELPNVESYDLKVYKIIGAQKTAVFSKYGIKDTEYNHSQAFDENARYCYTVSSVVNGTTVYPTGMSQDGISFITVTNPETSPVNSGINFDFGGYISKDVLKNYLSRVLSVSVFQDPVSQREDLRMIFNTGAKYISRAYGEWLPLSCTDQRYENIKNEIDYAHSLDKDLLFEAAIFETVTTAVNSIPIPTKVFEAFGLPYEQRNFSYDKIRYANGIGVDQWGDGISVPDITSTETQMFFYYKATAYLDMGFEALHFGQMNLMSQNTGADDAVTSLYEKIRDYAALNSRRRLVLINAHTHGTLGSDGRLLYDFNAFPTRIATDASLAPHEPSENNPQPAYFEFGTTDSGPIYKRSLGGIMRNGARTEHLPYFVELDNYGIDYNILNQPGFDCFPWGYDEISWFASQPDSYRQYWLEYAYGWVHSNDEDGYFAMPGSRPAGVFRPSYPENNHVVIGAYHANDKNFSKSGFNDESTIRNIFLQYK